MKIFLVNTLEMYLHHRILGIYREAGAFVTASFFAAGKMEEMGFPGEIVRLPYFLALEENFNPENHYRKLMGIYLRAGSRPRVTGSGSGDGIPCPASRRLKSENRR